MLPPILNALESLGLNLYMLQDDRRLRGSVIGSDLDSILEYDDFQMYSRHYIHTRYSAEVGSRRPDYEDFAKLLVLQTVHRFETWIRKDALQGSSAGQASSDSIYADVLKRISQLAPDEPKPDLESRDALSERVTKLGQRASLFSQYGLVPKFDAEILNKEISSAPTTGLAAIIAVLGPYVESPSARLDALESSQQIIDSLITSINSFFLNKSVVFDVRGGLEVVLDDEKRTRLDPTLLSSGERQVLMLLCNCVTAPKNSIFVVDEPELSLNIKWQRQLTRALLACTEHSQVQFLLATHSFELISGHRESVVQLEPVKG